MKNYKYLVPIALIAVFILSFYQLYSMRSQTENEYRNCLKLAREQREHGIYADAETNYLKALEMQPTLDLYMELGAFYKESDQDKKVEKLGESIIDLYPEESSAYELLMEYFYESKDYAACFETADKYRYHKLTSEKIETILNDIEYNYFLEEEYDEVSVFSDGYCAVRRGDYWGYANANGKLVISAAYISAGPFGNEVAPVIDKKEEAYFIDTEGNKKIDLSELGHITKLGIMTNAGFSAYIDDKWNYYDKEQTLLFGGFEAATPIGNGVAAVKTGANWYLTGTDGSKQTDREYNDIVGDGKGIVSRFDRCFVHSGQSYEMIDTEGNVVASGFEGAQLFIDEGYAAVEKNGLWGFIDKDGRIAIDYSFEEAKSFSNGLAAVRQGGLWGYIDEKGNFVIHPALEDAGNFNAAGNAFVKINEKWKILRLYQYNH